MDRVVIGMNGKPKDDKGHDPKKVSAVPTYYPVWLDLSGKSCVVVGGGQVAERKIASLLEANADVTVVSLQVTQIVSEWIEQGRVKGLLKAYDAEYSKAAFLVIAATNSSDVNEQVYKDAIQRDQLINRVDTPEQSNFIVPAVLRRGKLAIAISTSGASPSLAAEIRQNLEDEYGKEYEIYVEFLGELRFMVQQRIEDPQQRRRILKEVLELNVLASIREGVFDKEQWLKRILGEISLT
jgi:precorrin-2 dehydrogenase/sirohydrochlorin ferrochelatase